MSEIVNKNNSDSLQDCVSQVLILLRQLNLDKRLSVEDGVLLGFDTLSLSSFLKLQQYLDALHTADVAHILEVLPLKERLTIWQLVKADRDGDILLEVSDAVQETLIADMDNHELLDSLDGQQLSRVHSALSYEEVTFFLKFFQKSH